MKRNLTKAQEKFLIGWHTGRNARCFNAKTVDTLIRKGYLSDTGKRLNVTRKGKNYCDKYHMKM